MRERRRLLKMAGVFGAQLFLTWNFGITTRAQEAIFPWTRGEVLFGLQAGFEKARLGIPLLVWADPSLNHFNLDDSIYPWNKMAAILGRNNLFYPATDISEADIKFVPGSKTFTKPEPDYTGPFQSCLIFCVPHLSTGMATHELGHTLGFVDFVLKTTNIAGHINPARCDKSDKPYSGVMSYCDINRRERWFGKDDHMLLKAVGLA